LATAALVAAAVSYYMVSQQVPRELTVVEGELASLRAELASLRAEVEGRLGQLEGNRQPGSPAEEPGTTGGARESPGGSPGTAGGGPESSGEGPGQASSEGQELAARLGAEIRLILILLSGQDRLGWAMTEAARQDWGMAAESMAAVSRTWELLPGMGELASQARACQAELSVCDGQGVVRLRLLWSESQKAVARQIAGVAAAVSDGWPDGSPP
jgi:hypothetical protein